MRTAIRQNETTQSTPAVKTNAMAASAHAYQRPGETNTPSIKTDRRRHQRVRIKLLGRFMRQNQQEYPCQVINISVGGIAMMAPVAAEIGEKIIAYIDELGRLEGEVVRILDGGFAMSINASQYKRDKLASQLTWLVNRAHLNLPDERRHTRLAPKNPFTQVKLTDGRVLSGKIIDVSLSGASIAVNIRPEIGEEIYLGKMRGQVIRHHADGIAIEFMDIQNPTALRRIID